MKKILLLTAAAAMALLMFLNTKTYAFTPAASLSAPDGILDQGASFTASLVLSSDDGSAFYPQGNISCDAGLTITGISGDGVQVNGNRFLSTSPQASFTIIISVTASGEGVQKIYANDIKMASLDGSGGDPLNTSASVRIITTAEIESSIAASVEESKAEASRQASIASSEAESRSIEESLAASRSAEESKAAASRSAEESRIAESRSIEESSIQASQAASRAEADSIAASIAAIEDAKRRSEAEAESSRNASIQASVEAEEESRRQSQAYESSVAASLAEETRESVEAESRSIAESEAESVSRSLEASESEAEASRQESLSEYEASVSQSESEYESSLEASKAARESSLEESRADLTRASESNGLYAVAYAGKRHSFHFAVEETNIKAPEGFERKELIIYKQKVLAWQSEEMAEDLYLVFGSMDREKENGFYYYDASSDSWISVQKTGNFTDISGEADAVTTAAPGVTEEGNTTGAPAPETGSVFGNTGKEMKRVVIAAVLAFILGCGIAGLIMYVIRRRREELL